MYFIKPLYLNSYIFSKLRIVWQSIFLELDLLITKQQN